MPQVQISAGTIEYADSGGDGPVVVLVGGLAIDGTLWDGVVAELRATHRCVVPTMPWGGHRLPMHPDADLSLEGHARLLGEFLDAAGLQDVTLVECDTGMAQVLAGERPDRIARLVLCSCEALDNYPPGLPGKTLGVVARMPGGVNFAFQQLRFKPARRLPMTYGRMTKRPIPHEVIDGWIEHLLSNREIRRDLTKYVRHLDRDVLLRAAERLSNFDKPALVVWGAEDRVMPIEHGRRLAEILPRGRFVEIPDSATLIPLDQPVALARTIREFVREAVPA